MQKPGEKIIFETERLVVRRFDHRDSDNYFALQGNPDVMRYIRPPRTRLESDIFLMEKILAAPQDEYKGYWAVELKGTQEFIGCFVIIPIPDDPEKTQMGYSFLPGFWGRGYATEVALTGVQYFYHHTPLNEIFGVTEIENTASQKVLLKAGFHFHHSKKEGDKELNVYILKRVA